MTSDDFFSSADVGLLSPAWAGTPIADQTGDRAILTTLLEAEVALAAAASSVGIVPDAALRVIREVAGSVELDCADLAVRARSGGNPVIPLVQDLRAAVAASDIDAARFVHRGATSQDILDTALMLVAKRSLRILAHDLSTTVTALATLADRYRATPMAARTLTQHSVPTTFGLKAAGWLMAASDALNTLTAAEATVPAQLGGAAGTLASFHEMAPGRELELVKQYAAELGLAEPPMPWHTTRTPVGNIADVLVGVAVALGKIAADIALLSRTEIAEVQEPTAGESSSMPQKQNPARSVLINAATRTAPGLAAELHSSAIAIDERPDGAWHAEWQTLRALLRAVGGAAQLAADLLPGLRVDTDRMLANLSITGPLIVSERINIVVGPILGSDAVKKIITASADDPSSLASHLHDALPDWADSAIRDLLDPRSYLGAYDALIDRALAHVKETS